MADTQQATEQQNQQKTIKLIIKRQDNDQAKPYEEEFEIPYRILILHIFTTKSKE